MKLFGYVILKEEEYEKRIQSVKDEYRSLIDMVNLKLHRRNLEYIRIVDEREALRSLVKEAPPMPYDGLDPRLKLWLRARFPYEPWVERLTEAVKTGDI